jgi:hypothetical protein
MAVRYHLLIRIGESEPAPEHRLFGRVAWTLVQLQQAGDRGVSPIEAPALRWSDYVFKLRKLGIIIETIEEPHGGIFSGHHVRYVLRTPIKILELSDPGHSATQSVGAFAEATP